MITLILFIIVFIVGFCSYFLAHKVHKDLSRDDKRHAVIWSILAFILGFTILSLSLFSLIVNYISVE